MNTRTAQIWCNLLCDTLHTATIFVELIENQVSEGLISGLSTHIFTGMISGMSSLPWMLMSLFGDVDGIGCCSAVLRQIVFFLGFLVPRCNLHHAIVYDPV